MAKASNNQFPSVLFTEGTAPAGPAAGDQRIFIASADHHLKRVDSASAVVDIEAIPDASVITYAPAVATDWDLDADPGDVDNALDQLASRVDDLETQLTPQAHEADAKTDYTTGDLDTEAEIIAAFNATNGKINSIIAKLEALGLLASS